MEDEKIPKLSIVAASRNDNYGGDLLVRLQNFADGILEQCEKYRFFAELILVEWNPPENEPRLSEAISWEKQGKYCVVRLVEVPSSVHNAYVYSDKLGLYEFIAKNVGVRRARGEFILVTNGDIIISDELFQYLALEKLDKNKLYRVNRFDVENNLPPGKSLDDRLEYCKAHVVRKNYMENAYQSYILEICNKYHLKGVLHTNACGDFQLMSRECWEAVRGYPELDTYPFMLDSFLEYRALFIGIAEHIIRDEGGVRVIYHIEHNSLSRKEDSEPLHVRCRRKGVYCLDYLQFLEFFAGAFTNRDVDFMNSREWGLGSYSLRETIVKSGRICGVIPEAPRPVAHDPKSVCDTKKWLGYIERTGEENSLNGRPICKWLNHLHLKNKLCNSEALSGDFFRKLFGALGMDDTKLIVFGSGSFYMLYLRPLLDRYGVAPKYFVDNNSRKVGQRFEGVVIRSPDVLLNENKEDIYIFIASEHYMDIRNQLIGMGFAEYTNFVWYHKVDIGETFLCQLLLAVNGA